MLSKVTEKLKFVWKTVENRVEKKVENGVFPPPQ